MCTKVVWICAEDRTWTHRCGKSMHEHWVCTTCEVHGLQISSKWKEKVSEEIEELKQMGILIPSYSIWSSPIVPVARPDCNVSVCVDFRRVNKLTVQDQYHIPLVAEIVDKVRNVGCLSKLDLNKGFYQVKMSEEDRAKTALVTPFGKYEFSRMPFGLVNANSTFQRLWIESWRVCMTFVLPTSMICSLQ